MAQRPTGGKKSDQSARAIRFRQKHLLAIADLDRFEAENLLDRAEKFAPLLDEKIKKLDTLRGRTLINLFFENSTRTQSSFELAGKRMGADVVNMSVKSSSVAKGETLIDTAATLNAMRPDLLVVRHGSSGAAELLSRTVDCAVINAGDGKHEHPTQALLDAAQPRRPLQRRASHIARRASSPHRPANTHARRSRKVGRKSFPRYARGLEGRRRRHDAPRPARTHDRRFLPQRA